MKLLTEEQWNTTNRAVVMRTAEGPTLPLALFVFGAVVEKEAEENNSYLVDMGFDVESMPIGLSVWEGEWQPDPPDHEGVSDSTHAVGTFRHLTEDELKDVLAGQSPWRPAPSEALIG